MDTQQQPTNEAVEKVVDDLKKDFKVVGSGRIHSWYTWAIIGIILGALVGITYVANRSGKIQESDASTKGSLVLSCPSSYQHVGIGGIGSASVTITTEQRGALTRTVSGLQESERTDEQLKGIIYNLKQAAINDCQTQVTRNKPPASISCAGRCGNPAITFPQGRPSDVCAFFTLDAKKSGENYLLTATAQTNPRSVSVVYTCVLPPNNAPVGTTPTNPVAPGGGNVATPTTTEGDYPQKTPWVNPRFKK